MGRTDDDHLLDSHDLVYKRNNGSDHDEKIDHEPLSVRVMGPLFTIPSIASQLLYAKSVLFTLFSVESQCLLH